MTVRFRKQNHWLCLYLAERKALDDTKVPRGGAMARIWLRGSRLRAPGKDLHAHPCRTFYNLQI